MTPMCKCGEEMQQVEEKQGKKRYSIVKLKVYNKKYYLKAIIRG
jgi:tmRNA-binding protein